MPITPQARGRNKVQNACYLLAFRQLSKYTSSQNSTTESLFTQDFHLVLTCRELNTSKEKHSKVCIPTLVM